MQTKHEQSQCRFVSFSGMDGAGKSTQIQRLCNRMNESGLRVQLITFWDDVATLRNLRETTGHKLFKGDIGVGSPSAPIHRLDKNVRSWPMTLVRLGLYFLDAISLRVVIHKAQRSDTHFVICDRYAYDELANLNLSNPAIRMYVRLVIWLVPKPDISYILDADPAQAQARKPEFLYTCRDSYLALSKLLGNMTLIPPMSVEAVEQQVQKHASLLFTFNGIHPAQT